MISENTSNVEQTDNDQQVAVLAEIVKRILIRRGNIELSDKPKVVKKAIVEFRKRIRVNGLEKFNDKTLISTINFYKNDEDLEADKAIGALIVYLAEDYVVQLLQSLQYPVIDDEDQEALDDACGTFCNLLAGNFKSGLTQLGYQELSMSHFSTFQNDVVNGVNYHYGEKHLTEISFEVRGYKCIVVDLTMGPLTKH